MSRLRQRFSNLVPLGEGTSGHVFRAHDVALNRDVALKLLRNIALVAEARSVAAIRHRNLVTIHEAAVDDETGAYLVMEFMDGGSLGDKSPSEIAPRVEDAIRICADV